jgi:Dam-replacing family
MASAIYFPLFWVLIGASKTAYSIFYLSADLQVPSMFQPRSPLSPTARRAGWQGFIYDLRTVRDRFVRIR